MQPSASQPVVNTASAAQPAWRTSERGPVYAVTAATGKTGGAVVLRLREMGLAVRAVVRRRDERSKALESAGAQVVVADMFDPQQMFDALRGARRAYFVPVMHPYMTDSAAVFAVAARDAGVESIVQLSQWTSSPEHPAWFTRQTRTIDRLFAGLRGVSHTVVNPGWFADNYLRVLDFATLLGIMPVLTGTSRSAPVANEDIARVVAAVLVDPDRHAGMRYRPTGPRLISGVEVVEIVSKVLGHRVLRMDLPIWMLGKVARMQGVHPFEISSLRHYVKDHLDGAFALGGGVTDVVQELTGSPAEPFETTVRRYAAMPFARPTAANRIKAVFNFLRTPAHPGFNLDRYDREMEFPVPQNPRYCHDSDAWRRDHALPPRRQEPDRSLGRARAVIPALSAGVR